MTWREKAQPIIRDVLVQTQGQTEREIRRALTAAYPFGERESHPYKAWLAEVAAQRGIVKQTVGKRRKLAAIEAVNGNLF